MLQIQPNISPIPYLGHLSQKKDKLSPCKSVQPEILEIGSDAISNIQRGLILVNSIPSLDKTSEECEFFGANSRENVDSKIVNQLCLTVLKTQEENIVNFPNTSIHDIICGQNLEKLKKPIEDFMEKGVARWTLYNNDGDQHTIGLVKHKDNIYVLDSLAGYYEDFNIANKAFSNFLKCNVVFSKKHQQKNDEYSCNNWTHANIDAVLAAIREDRLTPDNLDDILPNDINKILSEQKDYVTKNIDSDKTLLVTYRKCKANFY